MRVFVWILTVRGMDSHPGLLLLAGAAAQVVGSYVLESILERMCI